MLEDPQWFTEIGVEEGCALSLRINAKLHEEQTPFQTIAIYDTTDFGKLMVIDNFVMITSRENFFYHEMMTHPVLFTHPNPQHVVIIGGGDCGSLQQVLRHDSVKSVIQVDIDERVTRLAEKYFPELCSGNTDPRVSLLFADAIKWISNAAESSVDVIIADSTDPIGPGEALFKREFYSQCRRVLKDDGLLVQQSESPLLHLELLKKMRQAMRDAGFSSLKTLTFPQLVYSSGWWSATMAGTGDLSVFRREAALNKTFTTQYYDADIHAASLVLPPQVRNTLGE